MAFKYGFVRAGELGPLDERVDLGLADGRALYVHRGALLKVLGATMRMGASAEETVLRAQLEAFGRAGGDADGAAAEPGAEEPRGAVLGAAELAALLSDCVAAPPSDDLVAVVLLKFGAPLLDGGALGARQTCADGSYAERSLDSPFSRAARHSFGELAAATCAHDDCYASR